MAIAPIQGMLRRSVASLSHSSVTFPNSNSLLSSRQILFNISIGIGSGLVGGYTFWFVPALLYGLSPCRFLVPRAITAIANQSLTRIDANQSLTRID